jgi:hypothetical protein
MKKRIRLSFLLFLLPFCAMAQENNEISLRDFRQATQFIASGDQVRDWDDEPCALVKIQGTKVDSVSGAFLVSKRAAETWVYMTSGDKRLTIFKQGYEPLTVRFDDYGIEGVKSNRVYLLVLFARELTQPKKWFFGVHAGVNFANTGDIDVTKDENTKLEHPDSPTMTTAFNIGATITYKFTDFLGVTSGLFYSYKGYEYKGEKNTSSNYDNENCSAHFLDVPILGTYFLNIGSNIDLQLLAGPYLALNIGGKVTRDATYLKKDFSDVFTSFDYGLQLGAGVTFSKHYAVNATYQLGLEKYKNRNLCLNLGYIF